MADEKLIKSVQNAFDINGYSIDRKLSNSVAKSLQNNPKLDFETGLNQLIDQILTQNLKTRRISVDDIKLALTECFKPASTLKDTETVFNVIDAFTIPKVLYDLDKQKYILRPADFDLFPDAEYKSLLFKERLDLLWYKTLKHSAFEPSKFGKIGEKKLQLVPIDFVLSESKTDVCIMGLLSQITEGQYWLEDFTGKIKINLKNAFFNSSLIMEGSIVLAKGKYIDEVFQVENIDFPPPEHSDKSRANIGDANTFGGPHPTTLKLSDKLKVYEEKSNDCLIFLSEFWVDNEQVLSKFREILATFDDSPPIAIVLCGHFLSSVTNVNSVKHLKEGFKKLANIVAEFPQAQQSTHFIFVPGPFDLGAPKILPRPGIPKYVIEDFIKIVPNTHLATNPCRLQYCTKEIVVFRENMLSKICRNTLYYPKRLNDGDEKEGTIPEAFANSIIRQSHLTPLLFSTIPVYWKYDQALHLYPTPDIIIAADDFQTYVAKNMPECKVINPGSFLKSNFSFCFYIPFENTAEINDVAEEDS